MKRPFVAGTLFHLSLLFGWAVAIAWLSLGSPPAVDYGLLSWDKLLHAGAYGLLMLLALRCLVDFQALSLTAGSLCWSAVVLYGGLLEIAQMALTHNRLAEWWDLVADGVGAALVLGIMLWFRGRMWNR